MANRDDDDEDLDWLGEPEDLEPILQIEDEDERHEAYGGQGQLLLGELTLYGRTQDMFMVGMLRAIFDAVVDGSHPSTRTEIYERLIEGVMAGELNACALLPFIGCEPEPLLVSRAVIDYCMAIPRPNDPPETGMRIVGGIMRSGQVLNLGAVFGGLLGLGDRRAHQYLLSVRDQLSLEEINQAVRIRTGVLSAGTVEFYLDWMEACRRGEADHVFGALAAGLMNQVAAAREPQVMTGQRAIPASAFSPTSHQRMAAWVPLADYAQQIAPRLRALDAAEAEPKLMPHVLEAWSLLREG